MTAAVSVLPDDFKSLETFVERWAVDGTANRAALRQTNSALDRQALYDAVKDVLAPALTYLDQKPLDQLDDKEQRLLKLLLSFAHVFQAIEVQGKDEDKHTQFRHFMRITKGVDDLDS